MIGSSATAADDEALPLPLQLPPSPSLPRPCRTGERAGGDPPVLPRGTILAAESAMMAAGAGERGAEAASLPPRPPPSSGRGPGTSADSEFGSSIRGQLKRIKKYGAPPKGKGKSVPAIGDWVGLGRWGRWGERREMMFPRCPSVRRAAAAADRKEP